MNALAVLFVHQLQRKMSLPTVQVIQNRVDENSGTLIVNIWALQEYLENSSCNALSCQVSKHVSKQLVWLQFSVIMLSYGNWLSVTSYRTNRQRKKSYVELQCWLIILCMFIFRISHIICLYISDFLFFLASTLFVCIITHLMLLLLIYKSAVSLMLMPISI